MFSRLMLVMLLLGGGKFVSFSKGDDELCSGLKKLPCGRTVGCVFVSNRCRVVEEGCALLSRVKCRWRAFRSHCVLENGSCAARPETAYPTRRPTASPTEFSCSLASTRQKCRTRKFRKTCVFLNGECGPRPTRQPTSFPTKRPSRSPTQFPTSSPTPKTICSEQGNTLSACNRIGKTTCLWKSRRCVPFACEALTRFQCKSRKYRGTCLYTKNSCQDFQCSALTRTQCRSLAYRNSCMLADNQCADRVPTSFPTKRPSKSPTQFPTRATSSPTKAPTTLEPTTVQPTGSPTVHPDGACICDFDAAFPSPSILQGDENGGERLGFAIAASGNTILAGSPGKNPTNGQAALGAGGITLASLNANGALEMQNQRSGDVGCKRLGAMLDLSGSVQIMFEKKGCSALFTSTAVAYTRSDNPDHPSIRQQNLDISDVAVSIQENSHFIAIFGDKSGVVATDSVVGISLNNWEGTGYTAADVGSAVTIAPCEADGCESATAIISGVRNDGRVRSIEVTNGGSGYSSTPRVTMPQPAGKSCCAASASATLNAAVGKIRTSFSEDGTTNSFSPPGLQGGASFGRIIAADGNLAVVSSAAAVHVLEMGDDGVWTVRAKISPELASDANSFGDALAISGTFIAVGAPGATVNGQANAGRVYIFHVDAPDDPTVITAPSPTSGARFGASVAIRSDGSLAVGAPGVSKTGFGSSEAPGAAFYSAQGWESVREITSVSDLASNGDRVGFDVAIGKSAIYVGAPERSNGDGAVFALNMCKRAISGNACAAE